MKVLNADSQVVLVGGSIIWPERLEEAANVQKPQHFGCANAIESAISKVSGMYEKLIIMKLPGSGCDFREAKL